MTARCSHGWRWYRCERCFSPFGLRLAQVEIERLRAADAAVLAFSETRFLEAARAMWLLANAVPEPA